jgi:hypothetical protein
LASKAKIQSHISYLRAAQRLLERVLGGGLTREQQFFQIAPGTSHIHWLVGHITWSLDEIVLKPVTGESMLDDTWAERYGTGRKAAPDDGSEKSLGEVQNQLRGCVEAAVEALGAREDGFLDEALPAESLASKIFKTRADLLTLTPLHIAYHAGQISLLRRCQGLESGLGM